MLKLLSINEEEQRALAIGDRIMSGEEVAASDDDLREAGYLDREVTLTELADSLRIRNETFLFNTLFGADRAVS